MIMRSNYLSMEYLLKSSADNNPTATPPRRNDPLSSMFVKAVQWEMLRANPVAKVDKPRFKHKAMCFLTDDWSVNPLRKLGKEKDLSFRAAVLLALLGSMRLGEMGELHWSDVSRTDGTVDITRAVKYTPRTGAFVNDPEIRDRERPENPMFLGLSLVEVTGFEPAAFGSRNRTNAPTMSY